MPVRVIVNQNVGLLAPGARGLAALISSKRSGFGAKRMKTARRRRARCRTVLCAGIFVLTASLVADSLHRCEQDPGTAALEEVRLRCPGLRFR